jgi:predicted  nucleic acid-binding Zn-ribbon protein
MAMSNCTQCSQLFQNTMSRTLCPECFGQRVFGQKPSTPGPAGEAPQPLLAHRLVGAAHALRCEVRADEGRAHRNSVHWGKAKFW